VGRDSPGVLSQIATGLTAKRGGEFHVFVQPRIHHAATAISAWTMPRQYDGTNLDRVSQIGPGAGANRGRRRRGANISAISQRVRRCDGDHGGADRNACHRSGHDRGRYGYDVTTGRFPIASIIDSLQFHLRAGRCRHSTLRAAARRRRSDRFRRGRASVLGDFCDAAGLSDAAFRAGLLDIHRRRARGRDGHSFGSCCRTSWRGSWRLPGRAATIFYYTTGLDGAPQCKSTTIRLVLRRGFQRYRAAVGSFRGLLFNLVELGECAGVIGYSSRLFWWGERNKQNNWDNLTFDGGFGGTGTTCLSDGLPMRRTSRAEAGTRLGKPYGAART
jgi:hypothetical protein